jgi:hypothetical protein
MSMAFGIKTSVSKEEQAAAKKRTMERAKKTPPSLRRDGGYSGYPMPSGSLERNKKK